MTSPTQLFFLKVTNCWWYTGNTFCLVNIPSISQVWPPITQGTWPLWPFTTWVIIAQRHLHSTDGLTSRFSSKRVMQVFEEKKHHQWRWDVFYSMFFFTYAGQNSPVHTFFVQPHDYIYILAKGFNKIKYPEPDFSHPKTKKSLQIPHEMPSVPISTTKTSRESPTHFLQLNRNGHCLRWRFFFVDVGFVGRFWWCVFCSQILVLKKVFFFEFWWMFTPKNLEIGGCSPIIDQKFPESFSKVYFFKKISSSEFSDTPSYEIHSVSMSKQTTIFWIYTPWN